MVIIKIFLALVLFVLVLRWQRRRKIRFSTQFKNDFVPLPFIGVGHLLFGDGEVKRKAFQAFGREALKQGGLTSLHCWIMNQFYTVIADPVAAELVLRNCLEKDDSMKLFGKLFHDTLPATSVAQWRPRRKTLNPTFGMKHLIEYVEIFRKNSQIMVKMLKETAGGGPFSIYKYISAESFDVICEILFGIEANALSNSGHQVLTALQDSSQLVGNRITQPLYHNQLIYGQTSQYRQLKTISETIRSFVDTNTKIKCEEIKREINASSNGINHNNVDKKTSKTMLQLMLEATHGDLSADYLQKEAMIMVFAGTDTTSVAFSFTCLMLAKYPDVQEKVYQELLEVFGDSKRPIGSEDLPKLKYTKAVLKETMRVHPPAMCLLRKIDRDLILPSGQTLIKDTGAIINVWAIHRNPEYWGEDAEQFRPERFLEGPPKHPAAYIPFSYGARNCIGAQFAMMSMEISLATLLRQYHIIPAKDSFYINDVKEEDIRTTFDILYRDVDNFPVRLQTREIVI